METVESVFIDGRQKRKRNRWQKKERLRSKAAMELYMNSKSVH